jgi:hypothetical protein
VHRRQLVRPRYLAAVEEIDEDSHAPEQVEYLADGVYLRVQSRQLRFVSVNK